MLRFRILAVGLLVFTAAARADDAIPAEFVRDVKQATVFIRVETDGGNRSGSGFVVAADGGKVLVVTNHHVAAKGPGKPSAIKVVFDSGTRSERAYSGEIVAADAERDLAVLKVNDVKDAPKAVDYARPAAPFETMTVYSFGFPFGQDLATGKGFPAITVGKASVSSLRNGSDGELAAIQIDGNLNPGNSGGPVVDAKGRLVGVAVAVFKEGQGIGFLIPAEEVVRTMQGRVGRVRVSSRKGTDDKPTVRIEADVIDPLAVFRSVTAYYVVVPPNGKTPDAAALDKQSGSGKVSLKIDEGVAAADFAVDKVEGQVSAQVVAEFSTGKVVATPVRNFSLFAGLRPGDLAGPPPDGWVDYQPKDKSFAVWLPAKPTQQAERQRNVETNGESIRISSVAGKTASGLFYSAEHAVLPAGLANNSPVKLHAMIRSALLDEGRGRFTESIEAQSGSLQGVQYQIDYGDEVARARVFISRGGIVRMVRVVGAADQVASAESETILQSFRLPNDRSAGKTPESPSTGGIPRSPPRTITPRPGSEPTIIAGGGAPIFKDVAPNGGMLIGLEIGVGKFGPWDTIKAVRPIYRVDGKEEFGKQHGTKPASPITIKAREGYALGAISCISGLNFDGFLLTFMRVKDGKLDPSDAYDSEWVGQVANKPRTRLGGDGTPVVGIAGRGTEREVNGLGLLFKGQEGLEQPIPAKAKGFEQQTTVKAEDRGKEPYIFGTIRDPRYKSVGPAGGVLIGLEAKFTKFGDRDIVRAVRPVYRVGDKEEVGPLTGADLDGALKLKAKEGYAVGGMSAKAEWWCHGFSLTYMKVKADGTLDPKESYESDWIGWDGPVPVARHTGEGLPALGLVGKIVGRDTTALGLLFKGQEGFDPNAPPHEDRQMLCVPLGKDPFILGSIRDPLFKSQGPAGGILIGLEAKFTRFGSHDIVRAVRPIYRVDGKEEYGKQVGGDLTDAVLLKAKDGYAIGAITGKAQAWCHGFSLTYMKVKGDGTLDPKDSYESDWVGWNGEMSLSRSSGGGTPVVGLVGKIVGTQTTALGLLFKGQEAFDPDSGRR